jgi:hypothetical protein
MADTTNATYDGGIDVPHCSLSGAKISIISETSKLFQYFFYEKQRETGFNASLSYVLSYYNNYVNFLVYYYQN